LKAFQARGFEILSVNIHREEDAMAVPFMKGNGYDFLPLKSPAKWAEDVYKVRYTPVNFLIDAEGRIVFNPDVRSKESLRTFENEIEALLKRAATK
jgi:hypothetical protein